MRADSDGVRAREQEDSAQRKPADVSGPRLGIVTVLHNSDHVLREFADALGPVDVGNVSLVLVDSGSADVTIARHVAAELGAEFVVAPGNVGYGTASNLGARRLEVDWFLFVNPDVRVHLGDLQRLVRAAQEAGFACAAPLLTRDVGRRREDENAMPVRPEFPVSGACMAVAAGAFREVGGFDECFFMFAEEEDLQLRLASKGYVTGIVETVLADTRGGASSAGVSARWSMAEREVARGRLILKHRGWLMFCASSARSMVRIASWSALSPRRQSLAQIVRGLAKAARDQSTGRHRRCEARLVDPEGTESSAAQRS
ncbi:glycosyltransferase [Actinotalea sp. JY-7876]|uniref:glycosyltransferase n=1 Tax=Actinotalea sp. JY-7876 TaxID=2758442 RepID=UPI0015F57C0B